MENTANVSYLVAFGSGVLIFLSPCIFPLIPSYLSYLTGISFKELKGDITPEDRNKVRIATMIHAIMFIIGFTIVFVALGTTVSYVGKMLFDFQDILKKVSAVIIILFGLMISGILRIGFLEKEKKVGYAKKSISYTGSLLVGATFAIAWTPCVGPILGSILVYASSTASMKLGVKLLTAFSLGLGVPFFISALLLNSFLLFSNKIKNYLRWINMAGGIILVVFGILILTGGIR
jgi:cytochrome c-type biogenesis protein